MKIHKLYFWCFRYLRFIRLGLHQGCYFFSAQMWAEMKRSVSYKVDIKIDANGVIRECQCECGAGQGPTAHCKHVGSTLYAIHRFQSDKDKYISEITCTQVR